MLRRRETDSGFSGCYRGCSPVAMVRQARAFVLDARRGLSVVVCSADGEGRLTSFLALRVGRGNH